MNLEDLVDENGLQQDEWSLGEPMFGKDEQLTVIGWSGKQGSNKFYILKCKTCSRDMQLFGEGYFKSLKGNLVNLGQVPCGCAFNPKWSREQYSVICSRKAREFGYTFLGFYGEWKGQKTKVILSCDKHGEWNTGNISNTLHTKHGCPSCGVESNIEASTKPDDIMIESFHKSGSFHPDTKFWRSERKTKQNSPIYWYMYCPECNLIAESLSGNLQKGSRPCACSEMRQQECYVNLLIEQDSGVVAVKFGVANNSKQRIKQQSSKCVYTIKQHSVYLFPDVYSCKNAERECLQQLECGVVLKRDMPDGYTETTWVYNLDKIIEIYERNGGIKIDYQ